MIKLLCTFILNGLWTLGRYPALPMTTPTLKAASLLYWDKHLSSHAEAVAPLRFRPGPHPFLTPLEWSCLLLHCTHIYWAPTLSQISTDLSSGGKTSPCSCRFDICQGCQFHLDTGDAKPCSLSLFCPFGLLGYSMPPRTQYFQNWIFHP